MTVCHKITFFTPKFCDIINSSCPGKHVIPISSAEVIFQFAAIHRMVFSIKIVCVPNIYLKKEQSAYH